jgi:DNA-binding XRE family transcriptional regulator
MAKKPKYNTNKIAANIKKHRAKHKLSREELAKKAKVNYNTIIKLESGANRNPTVNTLLGICTVFGCVIEEVIS